MTIRALIAVLNSLPEHHETTPTIELTVTDNDGTYTESGPLLGIQIVGDTLLLVGDVAGEKR